MRHIAVALIVITALVLDFLAYALHLPVSEQNGWDKVGAYALIAAVIWFVVRGKEA